MKSIVQFINEGFDFKELKTVPLKIRNTALKMSYALYGGDFNELYKAADNGNKSEVNNIIKQINQSYRNPVFSQEYKSIIINNWDEVKIAINIIDKNNNIFILI